MAVNTAPTPISALRGSGRVLRGRGRGSVTRVLLDMDDAMAGPLEGIAATDEAVIQFGRIISAAIANNRGAVISLAEYGQGRAARAREELRRIAAAIEPDGPDAA